MTESRQPPRLDGVPASGEPTPGDVDLVEVSSEGQLTTERLDRMGAWTNDCVAWLPKEFHPNRNDARMFFARECGVDYILTRARSVFVRGFDTPRGEWDVTYYECAADDEGAVSAWRVE